MSFKLRSVNTKFWEDPFIEGLRPEEKLLFLYLLTNPQTNMIGIYEVTVKRISYDTGLTSERIEKALKVFDKSNRVFYHDNYVILPNFLKNQNLNTNMQKGALKIYDKLPNWLKDKINDKPLKAFESLRNAMLNMNRIESKYELELESECSSAINAEIIIPEFEEFKDYALLNKKNVDIEALRLKHEAWRVAGWKDGNGKAIKNWKSKLLNTLPFLKESNIKGGWDVKKEDQSNFEE